MSESNRSVSVVLITLLLMAAGCAAAPRAKPTSKRIDDPRPTATDTGQPVSSSMADAAIEPAKLSADDKSAYYNESAISQDLVSVDLEPSLSVDSTELAVHEFEQPEVAPAQPAVAVAGRELVPAINQSPGSSVLTTSATHFEQVEFASAAALQALEDGVQRDTSGVSSLALSAPNDVALAGCGLFHENPPPCRESIDLGLGTISSIIHPCGLQYLAPYLDLASQFDHAPTDGATTSQTAIKASCPPASWWEQSVMMPARPGAKSIPLDIESLVVRTLANSKYLQGLADLPVIREKSTMEAIAEFDTAGFMESHFRRPSDPVGNQLTVGPGGGNRFRENDFASSAGVARRTTRGGQVQFAQEIGLLTNNSTFIDPKYQGNSRLTLNITQPLLSGSGKAYNTSLIMLAKMDERLAWDQVSEQLQDYLVEVTGAYWQLYLERARLTQKEQHLLRAETILSELEQRREIDAVDNQIARARSAVHSRRSELIRARTQVRNVESRLRALVNDPELYGSAIEVVPAEAPQCHPLDLSVREAMSQALQSRSEIDQAIQKVRAASVRLSVAKNELLPVLDLVLESYLSGLRGDNDIGRAWVDQFSVGEPSYSAGVRYEIPLNNRLAKNRHQRRRVEMRQAISQFEFQVEELMSEVEIAVREVDTAYEEMLARHEAMVASQIDLEYFQQRWELVPGEDRSASFLLEDILEAQDRLAAAEFNYAQTQVSYAVSIVELKRAVGILIQSEQIHTDRDCRCGLPEYRFQKEGAVIETYQTADPERLPVTDEFLETFPAREGDLETEDYSETLPVPDEEPEAAPADNDYLRLMPFKSELIETHVFEGPAEIPSPNSASFDHSTAPVFIESVDLIRPESRP